MLLVKYTCHGNSILAFMIEERLYNCNDVHIGLPEDPKKFEEKPEAYISLARIMYNALVTHRLDRSISFVEVGQADIVEVVTWPE